MMMVWATALIGLAMALCALFVPLTRHLAVRLNMMDIPGRHKAHARAVPLLGGVAIFLAIAIPSAGDMALAAYWAAQGAQAWLPANLKIHLPGVAAKTPQAMGILAAALAMHIMGLIDDRKSLGPWIKLVGQFVICGAVVGGCNVRVLTMAGPTLSILATTLWLVAITNSFNFLDNMDGLAAGVAALCAAALLGAAASLGQLFVSAWLCLIAGAALGFLLHNFPPASTFMGDAGSLALGFLLGVVSCLTTYVPPGTTHYLYGLLAPLIVMAVPLYDTISVMALRIRAQHNPMVGDRRHFSHRLVRRGMSPRSAILTIYLCTAATAISATLLPMVSSASGAALIFLQTLAILGVIAFLEGGEAV